MYDKGIEEIGQIPPPLKRALLGLVRPLPSAGGGAVAGLPTISVTNRHGGKIQPAMESPGRNLSDEVEKFNLGTRRGMLSDVEQTT